MSRTHRVPKELLPQDLSIVNSDSNFFDIVAKFGPLVIAIIAVAFCFYIYKKVTEMENTPEGILKKFIEDQTRTNFNIQDSYNAMVEQFNVLSGVVHKNVDPGETKPVVIHDLKTDGEEALEIVDNGSDVSVKSSTKQRKGKKSKTEVNL